MPHVKDSPRGSPWSPGKDDEPPIKPSNRNEPGLAVITPRVWPREVPATKDLLCTKHIEPAFEQGLLALSPIARDAHALL